MADYQTLSCHRICDILLNVQLQEAISQFCFPAADVLLNTGPKSPNYWHERKTQKIFRSHSLTVFDSTAQPIQIPIQPMNLLQIHCEFVLKTLSSTTLSITLFRLPQPERLKGLTTN